MSLLSDAEAASRLTATITLWVDGRPVEALCPVCRVECGVWHGHQLSQHGPPQNRCLGSGARLAVG
jgi:hypothetical protein